MAILGNVGLGVTPILTTDTVLIDVSSLPNSPDRVGITGATIHNDGSAAGPVVAQFFLSPDLTSASGTRIYHVSIADNATAEITGLIHQAVSTGENVISPIRS